MPDRVPEDNKNRKMRVYPNNFEAEQSVLCCMLIDGDVARNVVPMLPVDAFYNDKNRKVYSAMSALFNANSPIDLITVYDYMEKNGLSDEETLPYLSSLNSLLPSGANFMHYAKIVFRDMTLRNVISSCNKIIEKAYESSDAEEVVYYAERAIYNLSKEMSHNELKHISSATIEVMERIEKLKKDKNSMRGLYTGFRLFDKVTNGLQNGDLIILAARPSVGKTAFALNFVANIAEKSDKPKCMAIFSLEMPSRQIAQRIMANMGGVSMADINSAELKSDGDTRLWKVTQKLSNSKIYINDSSLISPAEVLSQCRRLGAEYNGGRLDLVVIDYLQLMSAATDKKGGSDNRQQEIAYMSRMMKIMARELDCPVVLLSQMSRGIENRKEKTPQLSDLRESGAIEQDADLVIFLYREFDEEREKSPVMLDLAKHRNGELTKIRLNLQGEFMTFTESDDQGEFMKKKPASRPDAPVEVEGE